MMVLYKQTKDQTTKESSNSQGHADMDQNGDNTVIPLCFSYWEHQIALSLHFYFWLRLHTDQRHNMKQKATGNVP